jgi:hypothetical protein
VQVAAEEDVLVTGIEVEILGIRVAFGGSGCLDVAAIVPIRTGEIPLSGIVLDHEAAWILLIFNHFQDSVFTSQIYVRPSPFERSLEIREI